MCKPSLLASHSHKKLFSNGEFRTILSMYTLAPKLLFCWSLYGSQCCRDFECFFTVFRFWARWNPNSRKIFSCFSSGVPCQTQLTSYCIHFSITSHSQTWIPPSTFSRFSQLLLSYQPFWCINRSQYFWMNK